MLIQTNIKLLTNDRNLSQLSKMHVYAAAHDVRQTWSPSNMHKLASNHAEIYQQTIYII